MGSISEPRKFPAFLAIALAALVLSAAALALSLTQLFHTGENVSAQAEKISAWIALQNDNKESDSVIGFCNRSDMPVYDVVITAVRLGTDGAAMNSGKAARKANPSGGFVKLLPPGSFQAKTAYLDGGMNMQFGVEIAFRDAGGHSWLRTADGHLRQLSQTPYAYYGIEKDIKSYCELQKQ